MQKKGAGAMLIVNKATNEIKLTRGETARLTVDLEDDAEQPYSLREGETLTLTVKRGVRYRDVCFQKTIKGDEAFHIKPEDTQHLPCGVYVYSVKVNTAEGDNYYVIEKTPFHIREEV